MPQHCHHWVPQAGSCQVPPLFNRPSPHAFPLIRPTDWSCTSITVVASHHSPRSAASLTPACLPIEHLLTELWLETLPLWIVPWLYTTTTLPASRTLPWIPFLVAASHQTLFNEGYSTAMQQHVVAGHWDFSHEPILLQCFSMCWHLYGAPIYNYKGVSSFS